VARKKKRTKPVRRSPNDLAQLKVRLPETLRRQLEHAASRANHSMNVEIVNRLTQTFLELDRTKIIANALVRDLDDDIVNEMVNIVRRWEAEDMAADAWREEEIDRAAERAGDQYIEHTRDMEREGGPEEGGSK
jgi:hypothetical protein